MSNINDNKKFIKKINQFNQFFIHTKEIFFSLLNHINFKFIIIKRKKIL